MASPSEALNRFSWPTSAPKGSYTMRSQGVFCLILIIEGSLSTALGAYPFCFINRPSASFSYFP